jgi:hypothetical protein
MLVVIFILYVGTTVFPSRATGAGATLTPSCVHPQSNENVICDKIFFRKNNVFLFLNITFPLGHMQNVRMRLEILSQTLKCQISLQFNVSSSVSVKPGALVRNVVLVVLLF